MQSPIAGSLKALPTHTSAVHQRWSLMQERQCERGLAPIRTERRCNGRRVPDGTFRWQPEGL